MMGLQSHELNKSQFRILQLKFLDKRIFKNGIDILSQFFYVFYLQNIKTHQVWIKISEQKEIEIIKNDENSRDEKKI